MDTFSTEWSKAARTSGSITFSSTRHQTGDDNPESTQDKDLEEQDNTTFYTFGRRSFADIAPKVVAVGTGGTAIQ